MSVLDAKKTYKNLKKKGFIDSISHGKDHKWIEFNFNGKYVCCTKVSHGNSELDDYLIKQMSTQCRLSKQEFIDLSNCPLSEEEYLKILSSKGLLD